MRCSRGIRCYLGTAIVALIVWGAACGSLRAEDSDRYAEAVRRFADTVLNHGRDTYGPRHTPLFVDGLHVKTLEPTVWKGPSETWVLSNLASQQPLFRVLDGLAALTGETRYRRAAEDATRHALEYVTTPNGLLYWGGALRVGSPKREAGRPVFRCPRTEESPTLLPLDVARDGDRRHRQFGCRFLEALVARRGLERAKGMQIQ